MIEIRNLNKNFKNIKALNNVNMNINKGDIYGFVGENGAGKSTLIKILANVIKPNSGEIKFKFDYKIGSIQAIVEEASIHLDLSAINNMIFQNDLFKLNKSKKDLENYLKLVGLENLINDKRKAKNFSLGMKQRLSIAMAIVVDPLILLLDEPMNGLDPIGIKDFRDLIIKLNQEKGMTFLISSHILSELDLVATKYGFISKGVLVEEISHHDLHKNSKNFIKVTFEERINDKDIKVLSKYNYHRLNDYTVQINDNISNSEIMKHLISNDCLVSNIEVINKSIEDYYLEVIKGEKHE